MQEIFITSVFLYLVVPLGLTSSNSHRSFFRKQVACSVALFSVVNLCTENSEEMLDHSIAYAVHHGTAQTATAFIKSVISRTFSRRKIAFHEVADDDDVRGTCTWIKDMPAIVS